MTHRPAEARRLRDLARLRRVRDRIDREYAQPLDVEALARGAHMSAGHLSREFRLAYGESPYSYLMTRRIERAMALLRRGDLSVTEVCFAVGCSSLGTFSTRFTELVGMPPSAYRRQAAQRDGGDAAVRGETGDQTDQESRSAGHRAAASVTVMDITIHASFLPARRPGRHPGLLSRHPRLRGPQRRRIRRDALDHGRPRRPARHVHRPVPAGRHPGITDDERRTIAEMMAKGTYGQHPPGHQGPRRHLRAAAGQRRRGRPGADRPAVRRSRLRVPRSRGQPDPHPGAGLSRGILGLETMSMAAKTSLQSRAPEVADSHDLIRVHGARVNNLKDVSVEIPKRRLTVFTGVSGSGKSSLVFGTIAAESQRLINETYSAFVQGFMPTLARPEVDVLDGLTTAIIVDQERMGANARSTVGTATDANAMLRILFSRLGQPHVGSPSAFSFNVASICGQRRRSPSSAAARP